MPNPFILPAVISAAGSLGSGLLGNKKTSQQPLIPDEVRNAWQNLINFGQTGKIGDFTAGEEVPLQYGNFDPTQIEQAGLSSLQNLLSSGIPSQYQLGDNALKNLLGSSQEQIQSQFDPFKAQVNRQIQDSENALKRGAAYTGNLYSTDTIKGLGDIQARGNETLTSQLAALTDQALNRQLQAIPLAYQSGSAQENILQNRLGSAFNYGGLTRQLNTAEAQARDNELLRRRQELQLPLQAFETVAGKSANYGIPSISSSPFSDLLGLAGQIGGQYLGNELFLKQYQNYFPTMPTSNNSQSYTTPNYGYPYNFGNKLKLF